MDASEYIKPGMSEELSYPVEEQHTAAHVGSGSLRVLATPIMIAFMERTARDLLAKYLPAGYSSVGVHVDVHHLAPSPLSSVVRVQCEVLSVDGPQVNFSVQAWDPVEKIGEGYHQRVVIDEERFLKRVNIKTASLAAGGATAP
jgi:fluoroacetyl-CoA thioesterase